MRTKYSAEAGRGLNLEKFLGNDERLAIIEKLRKLPAKNSEAEKIVAIKNDPILRVLYGGDVFTDLSVQIRDTKSVLPLPKNQKTSRSLPSVKISPYPPENTANSAPQRLQTRISFKFLRGGKHLPREFTCVLETNGEPFSISEHFPSKKPSANSPFYEGSVAFHLYKDLNGQNIRPQDASQTSALKKTLSRFDVLLHLVSNTEEQQSGQNQRGK